VVVDATTADVNLELEEFSVVVEEKVRTTEEVFAAEEVSIGEEAWTEDEREV